MAAYRGRSTHSRNLYETTTHRLGHHRRPLRRAQNHFSIPTQLKAWIDRLAQPGRTFQYTANGPEGLAKGKTVIVASTRGGVYSTSEGGQAMEHQKSYLKVVFGFFGITDVRFVRAEGVAMGDDAKAAALDSAEQSIRAQVVAANQSTMAQAS